MKCSQFCTEQTRPTFIALQESPWRREVKFMPSGLPYSPPHYCSRLELPKIPNARERIERAVVRRTTTSQHHSLFVQTAKRPDHDSLQSTLNSLEQAGLHRWKGPCWIVSDGYLPEAPPPWQVFAVTTEQPALGSAKTFLAILRKALEVDPQLEYLTYLQDDIILSKNSLDYIAQVSIPDDLSLVSWFNTDWLKPEWGIEGPAKGKWTGKTHDTLNVTIYISPPVLGCRPTRYFIRSQAITLTRPAISAMLYCRVVANWPRLTSCDAMPAWALADIPYADHYPSLVQHTEGFNSACNLTLQRRNVTDACPHQGPRVSPSFIGEDFDALSLLP
jgi:hypothetical protein